MADSVNQPSNDVVGVEGKAVTLNCKYNVTSTAYQVYLFWYKFQANDFPQYVLRTDSFGGNDNSDEFKERFKAQLNNTMKSVPLTIQNLQLSDSAVYHCALRPTVSLSDCSLIQKHRISFIHVCCYTFCDDDE